MELKRTIKNCIKGDRKAQKLLYEQSKGAVMGICIRYCQAKMEAEDVFQESMVKIFHQLKDLREPQAYWGWMRQLVVRSCISHFRKNNPMLAYTDVPLEKENNAYSDILGSLELEALLSVINRLPSGYKVIFNLYEVEGYKHQEIAELLNISEGTSKSQLSKAKKMLAKLLLEQDMYHHNRIANGE